MERKLISIIVVFFIISLFYGCGYFENDEIDYRMTLINRIEIQKRVSSSHYDLAYVKNEEIQYIVVNDCKAVYYDSLNDKIFVESTLNKFNNIYYIININDDTSKMAINAISVKEISKKNYNNFIKAKEKKWESPD